MTKGPDAFRTISEVAEELNIPQHVLRFWETRFTQIRPVKRGGGRRFYRPDDVALLRGIRHLLYGAGYTIRGVQRILKEQGVSHVQGLVPSAQHPLPAGEPAVSAPLETVTGARAHQIETEETQGLSRSGETAGVAEMGDSGFHDAGRLTGASEPQQPQGGGEARPMDARGVDASAPPQAETDYAGQLADGEALPDQFASSDELQQNSSNAAYGYSGSAQIDALIDRYAPGPLSSRGDRNRPQRQTAAEDRLIAPDYRLGDATREQLQAVIDELRECRRLLGNALTREHD